MTNKLQKGDLVKIGRKKDRYRVKQVSPSGEGAVLVETVDAKPYATTYVNADQLTSVKSDTAPAFPTPPVARPFLVTLTHPTGALEVEVEAVDEASAIAAAKATLPVDGTAPVVTDAFAKPAQA